MYANKTTAKELPFAVVFCVFLCVGFGGETRDGFELAIEQAFAAEAYHFTDFAYGQVFFFQKLRCGLYTEVDQVFENGLPCVNGTRGRFSCPLALDSRIRL